MSFNQRMNNWVHNGRLMPPDCGRGTSFVIPVGAGTFVTHRIHGSKIRNGKDNESQKFFSVRLHKKRFVHAEFWFLQRRGTTKLWKEMGTFVFFSRFVVDFCINCNLQKVQKEELMWTNRSPSQRWLRPKKPLPEPEKKSCGKKQTQIWVPCWSLAAVV